MAWNASSLTRGGSPPVWEQGLVGGKASGHFLVCSLAAPHCSKSFRKGKARVLMVGSSICVVRVFRLVFALQV